MSETNTLSRVEMLEREGQHIDRELVQIEARLNARFTRLEDRVERVNERIDRLLHWVAVFTAVSGFAGLALILAIALRQP